MSDAFPPVEIRAWQPAPFAVEGESIFAVGDVHGCARELRALLRTIAATPTPPGRRRRLVYLGDLVDRGPDVIGGLAAWAEDERGSSVDRIDRIVGNHEQVFLMAIGEGARAAKAAALWRGKAMGGERFLEQMRLQVGDPEALPGRALAEAALGAAVLDLLDSEMPHITIGNTLFVHGGIDPRADRALYLARPWRNALDEARYAWIMEGFLDWRGGFGGLLVVHGHTPPPKHRALTGQADPHLFMHDRLGLDGGSARTGYVTAAQIEDGRYRIMRAGTLLDAAML